MAADLLIRAAQDADSRDIWRWRNDATTRAMSVHSTEISWDAHAAWFAQAVAAGDRRFYVGELGGAKIGLCRFDLAHDGASAEVSINLNPDRRGQGVGASLLAGCIARFRQEFPVGLTATIRPDNPASQRIFARCGFVLVDNDGRDGFGHYRL
ncbi:MAG: N-Acetylneuraminate [Rhodospirillaceae bacterium]|nr:MAG: N-Acetylneuraminate [Rhodospirillaceae bacterium]TNC94509.1 MAG: N-Acetylneuraminate cytidylyltransferase [Stygiobacter sp.]